MNSFKGFLQILVDPVGLPLPPTMINYVQAWCETSFFRPLVNSVIVSATTTACVILLTAPAAYKLAPTHSWYSRILYSVFLMAMIVPFQTEMIPMAQQTIPLSQLAFFSEFTPNRWNLLLAVGVMAALPAIILYVFTQKYIIRGLVAGAIKA